MKSGPRQCELGGIAATLAGYSLIVAMLLTTCFTVRVTAVVALHETHSVLPFVGFAIAGILIVVGRHLERRSRKLYSGAGDPRDPPGENRVDQPPDATKPVGPRGGKGLPPLVAYHELDKEG